MLRERSLTAFDLWPQWMAAVSVTIVAISIGLATGWTSPYLAKFTNEESSFRITESEASWVASLLPLGRLVGAVCGSLAVEYLGSKISLVLTGLPLVISWLCEICATSVTWLYVHRLLAGISVGMFFSCFPLFLGEISAANIRGALVGLVINGIPIGILIGNIMGSQMSSSLFGIISLMVTLLYFLTFPCLPKSPYFLVRRNSMDKAAEAIRFYHRKSDITEELSAIKAFVREIDVATVRDRFKLMAEPKHRRAFFIVISLFFFMQFSGLNSIVFYMEIILRNAKVTFVAPSTVVVFIGTLGIIFGWVAIYTIDRWGRKCLLILSSTSVAISMILLGTHFLLLKEGFDPVALQPIPIVSLITFMMLSIGLIPVPSTLLSELFPVTLKSIAGFVCSITSAAFAFISTKTYQPLINLVTEQYVFWVYATIMFFAIPYTVFCVPETKGKTLKEIQDLLGQESETEERGHRAEQRVHRRDVREEE